MQSIPERFVPDQSNIHSPMSQCRAVLWHMEAYVSPSGAHDELAYSARHDFGSFPLVIAAIIQTDTSSSSPCSRSLAAKDGPVAERTRAWLCRQSFGGTGIALPMWTSVMSPACICQLTASLLKCRQPFISSSPVPLQSGRVLHRAIFSSRRRVTLMRALCLPLLPRLRP
jgi:hypothetical protein